jgi:hypothetical protein
LIQSTDVVGLPISRGNNPVNDIKIRKKAWKASFADYAADFGVAPVVTAHL